MGYIFTLSFWRSRGTCLRLIRVIDMVKTYRQKPPLSVLALSASKPRAHKTNLLAMPVETSSHKLAQQLSLFA